MALEQKYQKHTDIGHVLHAPDMYIGPIQPSTTTQWVMEEGKMVQHTHEYIPALYKIFDEILVNAADQSKRKEETDTPVTYIKCTLREGTITVVNDGPGIDVEMHPVYKVYIPQLIFAELRTSTNYDTSEKKIVGGKNGFGAKLAFIWSTYARIETVDGARGLKYTQEFHSNLSKIDAPTITSYKKKPYTSITFTPDYARFGIPGLDSSMLKLFEKRVMDIAAVTHKRVKVSLNETVLSVHDFPHYMDLYGVPMKVVESHPRWELGASFSEDAHQVSFVNGIYTQKGGKHVDYFVNQLIRKMGAYIQTKKKIDVRPSILRDRLFVFIHCSIENPTFDSQTKDYLSTPSSMFGSSFEISDKFVKKLVDSGFMDVAVSMTQQKEMAAAKRNDGSKTRTIRGIPKLVDANRAGTVDSGKCTLILTEGDSAAASVVSGLSKDDRNLIGVYPMRGKMLNTRGETLSRINQNKEIQELRQILGLELGKKYTAGDIEKTLRYGKVRFITDQDKDGSHIKGLGVNMFGSLWETLLEHRGFIGYMNTPIIKARRGKEEVLFYNDVQYDEWKSTTDTRGWDIKYYKGLGTSTSKEFIEYFKQKEQLTVLFECSEKCKDTIDMVFNKARADDRKRWLEQYSKHATVDTRTRVISYDTFVHKELSHFSNYDCIRSIPNVMDGMKPSQRKVLYACFKRKLTKEIKVAQLSGYVSEHTAYHHGEASLNGTIVGMAQDFVGSNNIELLKPNGQFGTRLNGGKDSASERYIFTELSKWTRCIFPEEDDPILEYINDDGETVEPVYYLPIIPMVLVNGCKGIGTGTSTHVLCYDPMTLIDAILLKLEGKEYPELHPYYRGFRGTIEDEKEMKYSVKGKYTQKDLTVHITELPIGTWTIDYKDTLEEMIGTTIKEYTDNSTDKEVNIQVKLVKPTEIEKTFKLSTSLSVRNMNLYNSNEQLTHYMNVRTILDEFYEVRWKGYEKRKAYQLAALRKDLHKIKNKVDYIRAVVSGKLDLRNKKSDVIIAEIVALKIEPYEGGFQYLTKLPMDSVSTERVMELEAEYTKMMKLLEELETTSIQTLWSRELMHLKKILNKA